MADPWEEDSYILCESGPEDVRWEYLYPGRTLALKDVETGTGAVVRFEWDGCFGDFDYRVMDVQPADCGFTLEDMEQHYKGLCTAYDYEELLRDPALHQGEKVRKTLTVFQVIEDEEYPGYLQLMTYADKGAYGFGEDIVSVCYQRHSPVESRFLEGDVINVYGTAEELLSYENVLEQTLTVPCIQAAYIDLVR